jgi:uncharacterized protein YecA (UPF0149 family)
MAIPDEKEWEVQDSDIGDKDFLEAMEDYLDQLTPKELDHLVNGVQEFYVSPYPVVGRNDPCPCGSGKKYKKCCGRE